MRLPTVVLPQYHDTTTLSTGSNLRGNAVPFSMHTQCSKRTKIALFSIGILILIFISSKAVSLSCCKGTSLSAATAHPNYGIYPPVPGFEQVSQNWSSLANLIILPGHAIQWCTELGKDIFDESCWYLEPFQHGQIPLFVEHIRIAIEELKKDPKALLIFSGGQTRPSVGPRSEAQSLLSLAERLNFFNSSNYFEMHSLYHRTTTEEYAKDSLENVTFSICRFRELVNRIPNKIKVVGFPFKRKRFVELHREAAGIDPDAFEYIGVELKGIDQTGLVDSAYLSFKQNLHGCSEALATKRRMRNPYKRTHPYNTSCHEMRHSLMACEKEL